MTKKITLALDCMGGDRAPQIVIEGADRIAETNLRVHFLLFGDSKKITKILNHARFLRGRYTIIHTPDAISGDEKPSNAVRRGTNSSMRLAIDAVKDGRADVVISAGNTGALMAISKIVLRSLPSIDRPAIVTCIPNTKRTATVFLDMGANIECPSDVLFQFAVMGSAFARAVLKTPHPTIGLLNVGSEELKGNDNVKNAAVMLKNSAYAEQFQGFVEGDDLVKGVVDVVVTDGFTGNITLKAIEGTAKLISGVLKEGFTGSVWSKIGYIFAAASLEKAKKRIDPRLYNGAMLVGLNGVVVKSHGSADSVSFANAIKVAISLVENKINEKITREVHLAAESIRNTTSQNSETTNSDK